MRKQSTLLFLVLLISTNWLAAQIPTGYYTTASGLTAAPLKTALYNIIKGHTAVSYTPGVWNAYYTTDLKPNGKVWDMYSDIPGETPPYEYSIGTNQCGSYSGEGSCYNREHSFPKSWFGDVAPMNVDLFHIYPTDGYVNGKRSNYPYGTVSVPTFKSKNGCKLGPCTAPGYTGIVFEPIDEYKGDLARTYFYMATRYENIIASWVTNAEAKPTLDGTAHPCFNPWFLKLLLAWNAADPVSTKEINRNNAVYAIQHNRNPYIDHPEYVNAVWGANPVVIEPSNHVLAFTLSSVISSALTLTWNNNDGAQAAENFIILANTSGSFTNPVDGVFTADDLNLSDNKGAVNVSHGAQTYTWSGLTANTTYYFEILPYTNSTTSTDYKTDGTIPAANGTTLVATSLTSSLNGLTGFNYIKGNGPSASQTYSISGAGLLPASGNITVTGTTDFEVSTDNSTFSSSLTVPYTSGTLLTTPVYVRMKAGLAAANYTTETITNTGGGATTVNVSCSGGVTQPASILATTTDLTGFSYISGSGPSASKNYSISGLGLLPASGNITVTAASDFEVSKNNTTYSNSLTVAYTIGTLVSTPVYVRMKAGLATGNYTGETIANTGGTATAVNVSCNGSVLHPATLTVSATELNGFSYDIGTGPSASQSYSITGVGLLPASGNITITGTADFEVSDNLTSFSNALNVPYTGGALLSTPVFLRMKAGLSTGVYTSETVANTGGSATTVNVICTGDVTNFMGIAESRAKNEGNFYINNGYISISVPSMEGDKVRIEIFNSFGQKIVQTKQMMTGGLRVVAPSQQGVYIVRVYDGVECYTSKVVDPGN